LKDPQPEVVAALGAHRTDTDRSVRYAVAGALGHHPEGGTDTTNGAREQAPRPKRITRPICPKTAHRANVEGTVVVTILMGEDGEVAHAEVVQSIPASRESASGV
jgi:outer membrane biosynthesis protein TonB